MSTSTLDLSTLVSFEHAAAGHDGTLSDASGTLFIKPCTSAEVEFYTVAAADHPDLAEFMPPFIGTLQLHKEDPSKSPTGTPAGTASTLGITDVGPMKGKALDTDVHIVLGNAAAGFVKSNILDLKLGARLWDDDAPPAKRARLDTVAEKSTSGSLGFRIAGMRTWMGPNRIEISKEDQEYAEIEAESNIKVHNKLYGRKFDAQNIVDGFKSFLFVPDAGITMPVSAGLASAFLDGIKQLYKVLEDKELRMYSASILMVYEGDGSALLEKQQKQQEESVEVPEEPENSDDDAAAEPKILAVKIIDFAHARFVPGEGPDENVLQGVRSVIKILEELQEEFQK